MANPLADIVSAHRAVNRPSWSADRQHVMTDDVDHLHAAAALG